jgi:hypothetical protein
VLAPCLREKSLAAYVSIFMKWTTKLAIRLKARINCGMRLSGLWMLVLGAALCQGPAAMDSPVKEFPFEFRDGLIWLRVQFRESAAPQNFLLDSGAGLSVINLGALRRMGSLRGRRMVVHGVGATTTGYWPEQLSAREGGLPLPSSFLAVDLSQLGRACGRTVDGLAGADFFDGHIVQIDFATLKIRLLPSSEGLTNRTTLPLEIHGRALEVPIRVNDGPTQWVRLDTGCAAALHWVSTQVRAQDCKPSLSVALTTIAADMTHTSVELAGFTFEGVPTAIHKQRLFEGEAGLLGNELLSRFSSVIIDAKAKRVILEGPPARP